MPPDSMTEYGLYLEIFFKSKNPKLAPIAGLLVAAKGQAAVERRAVEIDAPGANTARDSASAVGIPRLHKTRQSERCVVGNLDRLVLGVVAHDGQHGAKNLLTCNFHLRRHVPEDGRANIVSTVEFGWPPRSTSHQRRPFRQRRTGSDPALFQTAPGSPAAPWWMPDQAGRPGESCRQPHVQPRTPHRAAREGSACAWETGSFGRRWCSRRERPGSPR